LVIKKRKTICDIEMASYESIEFVSSWWHLFPVTIGCTSLDRITNGIYQMIV